jgi:hypothetical protein
MKGFFKVSHFVKTTLDGDYFELEEFVPRGTYVAGKYILEVIKYDSVKEYNDLSECKLKEDGSRTCVYELVAKNKVKLINVLNGHASKRVYYILHPSEHEHIKRCLAGTDDPMYDFVHELRYNPQSLPKSAELIEGTNNFNKRQRGDEKEER